MSTVTSRSWMISAAVAVLIVLATTAGGETPQQPNQDTLGALLVEVRGLRGAIEQMASVGPRVQLAMGRLQLHEQRLGDVRVRFDPDLGPASSARMRVDHFDRDDVDTEGLGQPGGREFVDCCRNGH